MSCGSRRVGWVVGESTPSRSTILFSRDSAARAGIYVVAEGSEGLVLGVVERVVSGNPLLPESLQDSREIEGLASYEHLGERLYKRGSVKWLSLVEPLVEGHGRVEYPRTPIDPSTEVCMAPRELLARVFEGGKGGSWIVIGRLLSEPEVRVGIDVNRLTRHMAILAVTGGGKSNTVCVLASRIVGELGGTMVIFDLHGEYSSMSLEGDSMKVVRPKIHPASLTFTELLRLLRLPPNATNQERVLREAWASTIERYRLGEISRGGFIEELRSAVARRGDRDSRAAVSGVLNRLDDLEDYYGDVLDESTHTGLEEIVEPGKLNIFDLSGLDQYGADAVVSHYLRRLLFERKRFKISGGSEGYPVPVIVVVEEAHVLIPKNEPMLTKAWASRIAREGRKFGVGLVIVSQRPKSLDPEVLSQTNNKIILRIVEPTDQRYVQQASEQLSEDLLDLLPDLNPGEAVVLGSMVRVPALVKIDRCSQPMGGGDIDVAGEWREWRERAASRDEEVLGSIYSE